MNDSHDKDVNAYNYNPNRPNNTNGQEDHEATKKALGVVEKGIGAYYGVNPETIDAVKKAPIVGKKIDAAEEKVAQKLDKIPGVKKAAQALNNSGVTDALNSGVSALGGKNGGATGNSGMQPAMGKNSFLGSKRSLKSDNPNLQQNLRKNTNFQNGINTANEEASEAPTEGQSDSKPSTNSNLSSSFNSNQNSNDQNDDSKKESMDNTAVKGFVNIIKKNPFLLLGLLGVGFMLLLFFALLSDSDNLGLSSAQYSYNSLCSAGTGGDAVSFIEGFEGVSGAACTIDGKDGHVAIDESDGTITVGPGVTNYATRKYTDYIKERGYEKYYSTNSNGLLVMQVGNCIPDEITDELKMKEIMDNQQEIIAYAESIGVGLTQYQADALVSLGFNAGTSTAKKAVDAYKENGLQGYWDAIKGIVYATDNNGVSSVRNGLPKRRKAEFALFVTGDYSDQGKFYSRPNFDIDPRNDVWTEEYLDMDSEGVLERQNNCSQTSTDGLVMTIDGFLARKSRPLRNNSIYYNQNDANLLAYTSLEGECAWYAGYRAQEILYNANVNKEWNSMPNGGDYCDVTEVTSGLFTKSTNVNAPHPGSLISWKGGSRYGHVAVVEEVYEDGSILISEAYISLGMYGSGARDYFHSLSSGVAAARKENCEGNGSGCFKTRIIPADQIENAGWSRGDQFACYIYLLG